MNQKQRAQWEQTRAKGMWRFILLNMVLITSPMIIGTSIYDYFTSFNGFRFKDLYIKVPIYLVGSFVLGEITWLIAEYKYEKSSQTNRSKLNSNYLKVLVPLTILILMILTIGLYFYLSSGNTSLDQNTGQITFPNQYANQNILSNASVGFLIGCKGELFGTLTWCVFPQNPKLIRC